MKEKVGIVTLVGNFNHGNRLQNFALQEAIKELGYEVDTLQVRYNEKLVKKVIKKIIGYSNLFIKHNAKVNTISRTQKIDKFTKKYLNQSPYTMPVSIDSGIDTYYSCFVVGSDQVWNPNYDPDDNYFLNFTHKKKISYAASLGVSSLEDDYKKKITNLLDSFDSISVREESAQVLLQSCLEQKIEHVLDPTFLLSKEKWESIISRRQISSTNEKYILLYFLGSIDNKVKEKIKFLSLKYNYKIIDMMDDRNIESYVIDPFEFLAFIKGSSLIFTDSFHGTVFSIILNRPFVVCERCLGKDGNMNTRIDSLLETFNLKERTFNNQNIENSWTEIDFTIPNKTLYEKRKQSKVFLETSLSNQL